MWEIWGLNQNSNFLLKKSGFVDRKDFLSPYLYDSLIYMTDFVFLNEVG